jgi:hypothetical protein
MPSSDLSHVSFTYAFGRLCDQAGDLNLSTFAGSPAAQKQALELIDKHKDSTPNDIFLETLVSSGNPALVARLLRHHGSKPYHRSLTRDLIVKVVRSDPKLLRLLNKSGFDLKSHRGVIINQAVEEDFPDIIKIWQGEMGRRGKLIQDGGSLNILDFATPRTARLLVDEITIALASPVYNRQCGFSAYRASLPKVFSALLSAGMTLSPEDVARLKISGARQAHMARIMNMWIGSNHSRLALMACETNTQDILGRPSDAAFYSAASLDREV